MKNITKNLETKPTKKKELRRLEGENLVFTRKYLNHFVTNKTMTYLNYLKFTTCQNTAVIF